MATQRFTFEGHFDVDDDKVAFQTAHANEQAGNMFLGIYLMEGWEGGSITLTPPASTPVTVDFDPMPPGFLLD